MLIVNMYWKEALMLFLRGVYLHSQVQEAVLSLRSAVGSWAPGKGPAQPAARSRAFAGALKSSFKALKGAERMSKAAEPAAVQPLSIPEAMLHQVLLPAARVSVYQR